MRFGEGQIEQLCEKFLHFLLCIFAIGLCFNIENVAMHYLLVIIYVYIFIKIYNTFYKIPK